jgi:predicted nucleotidyltransferase
VDPVIAGIAKEHSGKILALLQSQASVREIILFGSRAKGNFREGSDIDIALRGASIEDCAKLSLAYDELFLPWKLDLVAYESIDAPELRSHIDKVGRSLFIR